MLAALLEAAGLTSVGLSASGAVAVVFRLEGIAQSNRAVTPCYLWPIVPLSRAHGYGMAARGNRSSSANHNLILRLSPLECVHPLGWPGSWDWEDMEVNWSLVLAGGGRGARRPRIANYSGHTGRLPAREATDWLESPGRSMGILENPGNSQPLVTLRMRGALPRLCVSQIGVAGRPAKSLA